MEGTRKDEKLEKEFKLTSASLNNRKTVFLITAIILLAGLMSYRSMPKEYFPELVIPEIYVSTPYPGGDAEFIRDKVISEFEEEINGIKDVDEITSTSVNDYGMIKVKFDFKVTPDEALRKVKDAIDKARSKPGFPELQVEPSVIQADVSDMPILNVNLSSNLYSADRLEEYAKMLKEKFEALPEVGEVDIRGVPEKKVVIEMDRIKMTANQVTFGDIENAIKSENVNLPSGDMLVGDRKVSVKIDGEYDDYRRLDSLIVKAENLESEVYLCDVVDTIFFGEADPTSFARQYDETVVMLDIKKASGQNLIHATEKVEAVS